MKKNKRELAAEKHLKNQTFTPKPKKYIAPLCGKSLYELITQCDRIRQSGFWGTMTLEEFYQDHLKGYRNGAELFNKMKDYYNSPLYKAMQEGDEKPLFTYSRIYFV